MDFVSYLDVFEKILNNPQPPAPYDNPDYFNYAKLNWSRMHRWLKQATIAPETKSVVMAITQPQNWIVITEPWCGDAAHIVPFFELLSALNPMIKVDYQLRDSPPFLINEYLTNGGKSIPKLIIRNSDGKDLGTWGPRPAECQELYNQLVAEKADFETLKTELQKWYNKDQGKLIQAELTQLLATTQQ
ncbi:thioredoxin family protein [Chitinophaga silvatica]|uniref:Thioredoxin family protein n=1 Tax=Chitinophaga silvatica TaxID=2282649 RepID=A0A3E1YHM9_9BACT|nr:thioredoxin family protein [Chitinophaga silvatica]RFS26955.1 thioredoxin family protein [Chitinophaga silvatica]